LAAGSRADRYAIILSDSPLAALVSSPSDSQSAAFAEPQSRIEAAQSSLKTELARRNVKVIASTKILLNAIYVLASPEQATALRALPGVVRVEKLRPLKPHLNRALALMNVPAAWTSVGGQQNAGLGSRIGILDSGIDHTHPAFQDPGLTIPAGFPKCNVASDCAFTNNKVIVARSYVQQLALYGFTSIDPTVTRPDDLSPRDRIGHGTAAAMIAAGETVHAPVADITGVAPKAFLGNYKIFGSPGVNDVTFADVVIQALEDAIADRMDVVALALGTPALWGPNDRGSTCQLSGSDPCDVYTDAVENAVRMGLTVVVSAGNDGDLGYLSPAQGSIESPGTAPNVITAGATTSSHILLSSVHVSGAGVPSTIQSISAFFGDGPKPAGPITRPLRDVSTLGDDGKACSPLNSDVLTGVFALIQRGDCSFATKVANAQAAGAAGVVIFQSNGSESLFSMVGLTNFGLPAVLIGASGGTALQSFLAAHRDYPVTLEPALTETVLTSPGDFDTIALFSSYGPATGDSTLKPELVGVGTDLYTATQSYDPNGNLYDPTGFTVVQGTSFGSAAVAGAVALVKQSNPAFQPAQFKSAVVNTANPAISDFDANGNLFPARVSAIGAGKLDAGAAVQTTVEVSPATLSFGVITGTLPTRTLTITNSGKSPATLQLAVSPRDADSNASVALSSNSATVAAGASTNITVRLQGSTPAPGSYEGVVTIQGGAVNLRVPYLYLVSDRKPYNAFALSGDGFDAEPGEVLELDVKVVDQFGAPVQGVPVRFYSTAGGGSITRGSATTDNLGIAFANAQIGSQIGAQEFAVDINNPAQFTIYFDGNARAPLVVSDNGVVNAASGQVGQGLAPGSYISIFGSALSDLTRTFATPYLPISLGGVSVSFDVPSKNISLPAPIHFVSSGQINVQIPWELQGQSSAIMKVSIGNFSSLNCDNSGSNCSAYTVPLNDYSPAMFEYTEASSGQRLAAALDSNFLLVGTNHPVARGSTVQLYVNGLGPVSNQPPSGQVSPAQPLATTRVTPTVTIGGQTAQVQFSGLAPFIVGLYQINVVVPTNIGTGVQNVVITQNGVLSKSSQLPVQ
jgi:uncharacterized protein (TIGR03437 family)